MVFGWKRCVRYCSGKSLCYCLLPKAFDLLRQTSADALCIVLVIFSPLIDLMQDQVRAMTECNIGAVYAGGADNKLIATATRETRTAVCHKLGMHYPVIVCVTASEQIILYYV